MTFFLFLNRNSFVSVKLGIGTSPLSVWVENVEALDVSKAEAKKLDKFIDKLYENLSKSENIK